jgi:N4-gp56 family major capsid protein|nr:MAG TPA: major capsid protein [Caudoviricetes sp.]
MADQTNGIYRGNVNPNFNANLTTSPGLAPAAQEFYNKTLLENIAPRLVHTQFGQKVSLPRGNGKTVKFRKWTPFPAITKPLTEGVVPDGQPLNMTEVSATIEPYGGYVTITDMVDMTSAVPVVTDSVELQADQGGLSIDHVTRSELHNQATNVQYAGGKTAISALTASDKLTMGDIRKAVRTLKKARAPKFSRGGKSHYIAIVGPDTVYDLQDDPTWEAVSQYQDKENIYSGEIGRMFGVVFVETTEAMVYGGMSFAAETKVASYTSGTKTVVLNRALNDDEADAIEAVKKIKIGENTLDVASARGTTLVLSGTVSTAPAAEDAVAIVGPGTSGAAVAATLIFGDKAYGIVDLDSRNVHTIVKPSGSGGTADPLNQVSTVGWKVNGFTAKLLQPTWLVQILHGISD